MSPPIRFYSGSTRELASIASINPAAEVLPSVVVPDGEEWRILHASVRLVTSAVVATRNVSLSVILPDGLTFIGSFSALLPQIAAQTRDYLFYPMGYAPAAVGMTDDVHVHAPWPEVPVPAGTLFQVFCQGFQVSDDFGALRLAVLK